MAILERLLRRYTWFTVGSSSSSFKNPVTLGKGWLERYGTDAVVHKFNCNWIAGLHDYSSARHWQDYGAGSATVFFEYFRQRRQGARTNPTSRIRDARLIDRLPLRVWAEAEALRRCGSPSSPC